MKKIASSRFKLADYKRNQFRVTPEYGTTIEDVQQPEFWTHVAAQLQPLDTIEIIPEDRSYFAVLLVLSAGKQFATVKLLHHVELESVAAPENPAVKIHADYTVEWKGPAAKWCVIRTDGEKMAKDFATRAEGENWLKEYVNKLAA